MTVFIPKGRTLFYVYFRMRLPGTVNTRQFARSCGTSNLVEAKARAAEIFAEEYIKIRGASNAVNSAGIGSSNSHPAAPLGNNEPVAEVSGAAKVDPTIEEIIVLYDEWIKWAKPGEVRPLPQTAKSNTTRLKQLARLVKAETVSELRAAMDGLKPETIRVSPGNFVSLLRAAAGPFWPKVLEFYKTKGTVIETPFVSLPKV